jgi:hypothetical protein
MDTLTLSPLGDLTVARPASWAVLADLAVSWPHDPGAPDFRIKQMRCAAAAIGLVVNDERLPLPKYRPATLDLVAYGESVLEVLIPRRVQLSTILRAGRVAGDWLSDALPTEQEVAETADFSVRAV